MKPVTGFRKVRNVINSKGTSFIGDRAAIIAKLLGSLVVAKLVKRCDKSLPKFGFLYLPSVLLKMLKIAVAGGVTAPPPIFV
jgi:hypothetical protein